MYIDWFWFFLIIFEISFNFDNICHNKTKQTFMSIIRLRELKEQNCSGCNNRLATVTEETEIKFQTPFETTLKSIKSGLTMLKLLSSSLSDLSVSGKFINLPHSTAINGNSPLGSSTYQQCIMLSQLAESFASFLPNHFLTAL